MKTPVTLLALLFVAFLISCNNYRYINTATPPNNPYFLKKGDSKLTAYYSSNADSRPAKVYAHGLDLQGAYAFRNHWALTASYFNRAEKDDYSKNFTIDDSSVLTYSRNLFDMGAGYFVAINPEKTTTFNAYGGYGKGSYFFNDDIHDGQTTTYHRYHKADINKFFVQPSVNFIPQDYLRLALAAKVSFLHYGNIRTSYTADELSYYSLDKVDGSTLVFVEPSLDFQVGMPNAPWMQLDMLFSFISSTQRFGQHLRTRGTNISIGLNFDFSKIKKNNSTGSNAAQ